MENKIIEKVVKALQPINYQPHYPGYFVKMNGIDQGGSDYCKNCISQAVKDARKWHKERRAEIIKKHEKFLTSGKYSRAQVMKSRRSQLKYYPSKASFTYEGHDPDFGGGLQEPCTCDGCGEPFQCAFESSKEEAEHLLKIVESGELSDCDKWELDIAFYHFKYSKPEAQAVLLLVAKTILSKQGIEI